MLRELDGKATKRRLMLAAHIALDNEPRLEAEGLGMADRRGVEEGFGRRSDWAPFFLARRTRRW
jgi:hypothetical protein